MIVPDHDLIGRVLRVFTAADDGEDVASEEHLDDADSSGIVVDEVSAEDLAEGVAVEDAEATVGGGGEAAVVLVEGEVEEGWGIRRRRRRPRRF